MKYRIWCPELNETEEDARVFMNQFVDFAIEEWARVQGIDNDDDIILTGGVCTVMVKDEAGKVTPYTVWGELKPKYYIEVQTRGYRVWCPAEGIEESEGVDVQATSASDAACKWAMQMDAERGGPILGSMFYVVRVRDGRVRMFRVNTQWSLSDRSAEAEEVWD